MPSDQHKGIQALRWIAILPAAVAAFFLAQLSYILIDSMNEPRNSTWWMQIVNSAIGSYALTYAGAWVAPKFRFIVSIILSTINAMFFVAIFVLSLIYTVSTPSWWLAITGSVSIAASIAACFQVHEEEKQRETEEYIAAKARVRAKLAEISEDAP